MGKYFCPQCHQYWVEDQRIRIIPYSPPNESFHYVTDDGTLIKACPRCAPYKKVWYNFSLEAKSHKNTGTILSTSPIHTEFKPCSSQLKRIMY